MHVAFQHENKTCFSKWLDHLFGLLDFCSLDTSFGIKTSFEHDTKPNKTWEEFVKWVFAEDKEISEGVTGKFTLEISGCSREELNGNYVQQTEYYYRRPIFHCQEKERYLFYHGKRHLVPKHPQWPGTCFFFKWIGLVWVTASAILQAEAAMADLFKNRYLCLRTLEDFSSCSYAWRWNHVGCLERGCRSLCPTISIWVW